MTDINAFIKVTNSKDIILKGNKTDGSRPFLDADNVEKLTLDGNELIKRLSNDDIDEIKNIILNDFDDKLDLAKGQNGNKVFDGLLQFLSSTSSGLLLGYLKSKGLIE
ncbi:hypothetical protein [Peribacillus simplex]|uniref:hypothetical protein n=1 Tax=Peribacillus simplex TaxID=1478 RepID=UPI0024C19283|nr:hypothetical protein [Peribacillus simplex]MDR4928271.1 hypothetical protein [Peribacillus simplex]WHX92033.1 hypothetical protein QNH50_03885 [Peribacillus simplex]